MNEVSKITNCWLSPEGYVTSCPLAEHLDVAVDILFEKGWEDEFLSYYKAKMGNSSEEFLQVVKGYQKLQTWENQSPRWIIGREPTQLQLDKMYELTGYKQ